MLRCASSLIPFCQWCGDETLEHKMPLGGPKSEYILAGHCEQECGKNRLAGDSFWRRSIPPVPIKLERTGPGFELWQSPAVQQPGSHLSINNIWPSQIDSDGNQQLAGHILKSMDLGIPG